MALTDARDVPAPITEEPEARRPLPSWYSHERAVTVVTLLGAVLFVFAQLHPSLLLRGTTPAGGDMGAHVWAPDYLRDHLLPSLRLTGWSPDWYAGFPAFHFYMVVPSLAIVVLDLVLPYGIAFKLVSVSGLLALPVALYAFGRMARIPFPGPPLFAVAGMAFLFDRSFSILGGNIPSTLAGEFAFSMSLAFAVLFLGVVVRGLDTGRDRGLAATLLAATVLCHLIPAIFALVGLAVMWLIEVVRRGTRLEWLALGLVPAVVAVAFADELLAGVLDLSGAPRTALTVAGFLTTVVVAAGAGRVLLVEARRQRATGVTPRVWWVATTAVVGSALTAWWTVPFVLRRAYLNDMGWEKYTQYSERLLPGNLGRSLTKMLDGVPLPFGWDWGGSGTTTADQVPGDITWVAVFAAVGLGVSLALRRLPGIYIGILAVVFGVAFVLAPQSRLWNARLLPFWFLCLYLLAALAVTEIVHAVAVLVAKDPDRPPRVPSLVAPLLVLAGTVAFLGMSLRALPWGEDKLRTNADGTTTQYYSWLGFDTTDRSYIPSWARWNYEGYEEKAAHPEYRALIDTMAALGRDPGHGCGRAMWEYDSKLDRFGTPMALMLLPYWTDGCIGSMEGLYFEASTTTPYHFLNQSELSLAPSRAQRGLRYGGLDVDLGVRHLQLMGVRYYMAFSPDAVAQADADDDLTEVATYDTWHVYEVSDAPLVEPVAAEPVVVRGVAKGGRTWQDMAEDWYLDPSRWVVLHAASGPASWERIVRDERPPARPVDTVEVTNVDEGRSTVSFDVSDVGTPVLVKTSYFPNWEAHGADGPWRVAPNFMVVVPTSTHVELRFGRTPVDWLGWLVTFAGVAAAVALFRRPALSVPDPPPRRRDPEVVEEPELRDLE